MDEALAVSAGKVGPYKILPAVVRKVSEVVERRLLLFDFR